MNTQPDVLDDLRKLANVGEYSELREAMENCLRPHERDGFADLLRRMRDNFAAVAELIAADRAFDEARAAADSMDKRANPAYRAAVTAQVAAAIDRRAAALARVGGGA